MNYIRSVKMIDSDEIINVVRFQIRKYSFNNFYIAFAGHLQFVFWFLGTLKKSYQKIIEMATFFKKYFYISQCAARGSNLDQKFQDWNYFCYFNWCHTSQNQPKKSSVNRFPFELGSKNRLELFLLINTLTLKMMFLS